jgi:aquaporin Z
MFMISACTFAAVLEHPASPVRMRVANADLRRFLGGMAMGLTAVLLIYSPFGRRSGAHMNPATTLTFYRLGKVGSWDAVFYLMSQFAGGVVGTLVAFSILGRALSYPNVNFAITRPGMSGISTAFIAEIFITFSARRATGVCRSPIAPTIAYAFLAFSNSRSDSRFAASREPTSFFSTAP